MNELTVLLAVLFGLEFLEAFFDFELAAGGGAGAGFS